MAGAELATATENSHKLTPGDTKVTAEMVDGLEDAIDEYVARTNMPEQFIVPGESRGSAFLDFARTVIRRAERQTVAMDRAGLLTDGEVVRYLNRLADLIFVLARYEEGDFRALRPRLTVRHVTDARGTAVALPDRVGRVVSLVPSLTEWLVVTGVGERLVGVTDWCVEPAGALEGLARVQGHQELTWRPSATSSPTWSWPTPRRTASWTCSAWRRSGLAVFVTMPTTVAEAEQAELRDLAAAVGDLPRAAALDADAWSRPWPTPTAAGRPGGSATPARCGATPGCGSAAARTRPTCSGWPGASRCWTTRPPATPSSTRGDWPPATPSGAAPLRAVRVRQRRRRRRWPPPSTGPGSSWPTAAPSPGTGRASRPPWPASASCSALLDQLGLDLEADGLAQQEPARLQGGVPDQAPLLPVDIGDDAGEADPLVAPGVDGAAEELEVDGDQVVPLMVRSPSTFLGLAVAGPDAGAAEADRGVVLDAEEVVGAHVGVAGLVLGVDQLASISISRVDSSRASAMVATPLATESLTRTLAIRCRAMNSNDWCDRSISSCRPRAPCAR